jgi:hypothetical protein
MLKLVAFLALFAGVCWFGTTVPLGAHTLFGHLHAISETKESQELFDATRQSAKPLVDNVRRRIAGLPEGTEAAPPSPPIAGAADGGPPQENVSASDRRRLRKLLSAADHTTSSH